MQRQLREEGRCKNDDSLPFGRLSSLIWRSPTLARLSTTIGRQSFTVLFGMGSGVTPDVNAPENRKRPFPIAPRKLELYRLNHRTIKPSCHFSMTR